MFDKKEAKEEVKVVVEKAPVKVACDNCDDSGKECYVCGAGREVIK